MLSKINKGALLGRVNLLANYFKVKIFYKFKLLVNTSCKVGGNVFYSEKWCVTKHIKK